MSVGWYVHHHGTGHLARLRAVAPWLPDVVALSSLQPVDPPCPWVPLARDTGPEPPADPTAGGTLHWAPAGHAGLRERMAAIAAWIAAERPRAFVVDVSVEVALLARLLGVPVVLVAQRGRRDDAAHRLAYAQAAAVAAPWTRATQLPGSTLPADRLRFCGAIARPVTAGRPVGTDVLVVLGAGGHALEAVDVEAAAAATPQRTWHVAGPLRCAGANVVDHGPAADVPALLRSCSVVVGSAGGNVVAEVAAARRAFVCLPQPRPFDEQLEQAAALERLGVAEVRRAWPAAAAWPGLLARAERRDPDRWGELHDGRGAERLAAVVRDVADATPVRREGAGTVAGHRDAAGPGADAARRPVRGPGAAAGRRVVGGAPAPRVAVVTLAGGRPRHLARQAAAVAALDPPAADYVVVAFEGDGPAGATLLPHPVPAGAPLPLAAARNRAIAAATDADLVVCLDVDCVPEPGMLAPMIAAAGRVPGVLLAGPVGRLAPLGDDEEPGAPAFAASRARALGGARPVLAPGSVVLEPRMELFWSLAFAVAPATHARIGGFDEAYVGYGAEDTDYALRARRAGVGLAWVGGAWSHHQHHPVSSPPVEHLADIVANALRFRARWGRWPMEGWLERFAADELIAWEPTGDELRVLQPQPPR